MTKLSRSVLVTAGVLLTLLAILGGYVLAGGGSETYVVNGSSMTPTFNDGQRLKIATADAPAQNDIVVFRHGDADKFPNGAKPGLIIKRIAAVAGDEVRLEDRSLSVNGQEIYKLPEGYECSKSEFAAEVPEGILFVLGDNHENSNDSLRAICDSDEEIYVQVGNVEAWGDAETVVPIWERVIGGFK